MDRKDQTLVNGTTAAIDPQVRMMAIGRGRSIIEIREKGLRIIVYIDGIFSKNDSSVARSNIDHTMITEPHNVKTRG